MTEVPQTAMDQQSARRRAAIALIASELVRRVAEQLMEPGIAVMPVKGALLQHWLYDDPSERPLTDVDLLVRPEHLLTAARVLERGGFRSSGRSSVGAIIMESPLGLPLDLHPRLFDSARYRLPTRAVFARSLPDDTLYGARVRIPSPLDVYAHLIGKFGSDHLDARAVQNLDEIARMSNRLHVPPEVIARHLAHCGMRRVSRYVLPLVSEATNDPLAAKVYESLPSDRMGRGVVALVDPLLKEASPSSRVGALAAHMLNDSLPRGVRSGVRALVLRL